MMRRFARIAAGVSLLFSATALRAEDAPVEDAAKWVARLNSDDFDERTAAVNHLAKMGESARDPLEKALAGNDPDLRVAAGALLARLRMAVIVVQAFDRAGKPLSNVEADCTLTDDRGVGGDQPKQVTTGADGSVTVTQAEPGFYNQNIIPKKFSLHGNNYYYYRVRLAPGRNTIPIVLTAGGACQGVAADEQGNPLKEARLQLTTLLAPDIDIDDSALLSRYAGSSRDLSAATDAAGKVKIEDVPDGVYRAIWSHENRESVLGPLVRIREGSTAELPAVKLQPQLRGSLHLTLQNDIVEKDGKDNKDDKGDKSDKSDKDGKDGAPNPKPLDKASFYVWLQPVLGDPAAEARATKAAINARMNSNDVPVHITDEKGQATLDNLKPGKFRLKVLTVDPNNQNRFVFQGQDVNNAKRLEFSAGVEIRSGETAELTIAPIKGGVIKGRIVSGDGTPLRDANVTLISESSLIAEGPNFLSYTYADESIADVQFKQTHQDGVYEFKRVGPGRCVVAVRTAGGETAQVYGVEAAEGKTVEVPEIKLKAVKKSFAEIKGRILLPGGAPANGATVFIETITPNGRSSSGSGANNLGEFAFNSNWFNGVAPNRLRIIMPGYHAAIIDLAAPNVKPDKLEIRLVKREYGRLLVKLVDDAGKPVAGAKVIPSSYPNAMFNRNGALRPILRSDDRGEVRLSGLSEGPRKIRVELLGYYTDPELNAEVKRDEESAVTVVLHKGLTIAGHVELPPGVPAALSTVVVRDNAGAAMWQALNPDGSFAVKGLLRGEYHVDAAAPGCSSLSTLAPDEKKPLNFVVKLVRNGAAAINLGAENAGKNAQIVRAESLEHLNPADFWQLYQNRTQDIVDDDGRVEFWGAEGAYLVFTGSDNSEGALSALCVAGTIQLKPIASAAELRALPAPPVKAAVGGGKVEFTLVPDFPAEIPDGLRSSYLTLFISGKDAMAWGYYQPQSDSGANTPLIIGTPPPELQAQSPNHFNVEHLPPGEYKLYALNQRSEARAEVVGDKPLAQFTVKDAQPVNIGEVKLPIPKPTREQIEAAQQMETMNDEDGDEDKTEVFKP